MRITQITLALAALCVGLAHSWDIAVSVGDQLIFYTNGIKTTTVNLISKNLAALAYDEVHNMMLYVDKQKNNDSICGYDISSMEDRCFIQRNGRNINGLAFDPATEILYFSDENERSINWISLKPGSENNAFGNLLIKLSSGTPADIAIDSCRGYIYWSTKEMKIERARLNGTEINQIIKVVLDISSFAIYPQTQAIYYVYGWEPTHTAFIKKVNFNGNNNLLQYVFHENMYNPKSLTFSKDHIYWMNGNASSKTVYQTPKNINIYAQPVKICTFNYNKRIGIAANYKIKDQVQGMQDCAALTRLIPTQSHEGDVSVCENYCLQGNCTSNDEGVPKCSCKAGYSGERCEVYACHSYCLNNGDCSLNGDDEPVCQCVGNYEGTRCEADKNNIDTPTYNSTPNFS